MSLYIEDYEQLEPGHEWMTEPHTVTIDDIATFAQLTGDTHPQHVEPEYGVQSAYGTVIAHGFLTISIASGLVYQLGMDIDAAHAILDMNWRLPRPVVPGDILRVRVVLREVRRSQSKPEYGVVERRYEVLNQSGETVAEGNVVLMVKRRAGMNQ